MNINSMKYNELDKLLSSMLKEENLPEVIEYDSSEINYHRSSSFIKVAGKAIYRLIKSQIFYYRYIRKKIKPLKKSPIGKILKKQRSFISLRMYIFLSKIGLTDLVEHLGGRFNDKIFANFAIVTLLYDSACDIPECKKYLKLFDDFIMNGTPIESDDIFLKLFVESMEYIKNHVDKETYDKSMDYVRIEHISQLMSIYQISDDSMTEKNLSKITFSKGGIAVLYLIHILVPHLTFQQRKALYELGGVLQIIDDITDIQEDLEANLHTLPNQKMLDQQKLLHLYYGTVNNLIEKCNMNPNKPNGTLDMLYWFSDKMIKRKYKTMIKNFK